MAQVVESEKNIIRYVANNLSLKLVVIIFLKHRVIASLIGDAYCTEPSSGLGDPCIRFVESFVPEAMPLAATLLRGDIDRLCTDAVLCV